MPNIIVKDLGISYYKRKNETTLPEHWKKKWPPFKTNNGGADIQISGDTSHCHPMFGNIVYDIISHIIGLNLSDIKDKYIRFDYKSKFNINKIKIKYKNNYINLKVMYINMVITLLK